MTREFFVQLLTIDDHNIENVCGELHEAIKKGDYAKVKRIINIFDSKSKKRLVNYTLYNNYGGTSLHLAAVHHHPKQCGCNLDNRCNKIFTTPDKIKTIKFLLKNGADPNIRDYYEDLPIDLSIKEGFLFSNPAVEVYDILNDWMKTPNLNINCQIFNQSIV